MRRGSGAILLAILLAFAGCIGTTGDADTNDSGTADDPASTPSGNDAEATEPAEGSGSASSSSSMFSGVTVKPLDQANRSDAFAATTQASDPATVQGFEWQVPEGAVVDSELGDGTTVVLEGRTVTGPNVNLTGLGLMFFDLEDGTVNPISANLRVPLEGTVQTATETRAISQPVEPGGFVARLGFDDLDPGDRVGVVLAARGNPGGPVGAVFQPFGENPGLDAQAPDSAEAVRSDATSTVALPEAGAGEALHGGVYSEGNFVGTNGVNGFTLRSDDVTVRDTVPEDPPPAVSARQLALESSFGASGGLSSANGFYISSSGAGQWSAQAQVHGASTEAGGPIAAVAPFVPAPAQPPQPVDPSVAYGLTASGSGASEASMSLEVVSVNQFEIFSFFHVGIGASLGELFDVQRDPVQFTDETLDDAPGPAVHIGEERLTVQRADGSTITLSVPAASGS